MSARESSEHAKQQQHGTCGPAGRVEAGAFVILLQGTVDSLLLALASLGVPHLKVPTVHVVTMDGMVAIPWVGCMASIPIVASGMGTLCDC